MERRLSDSNNEILFNWEKSKLEYEIRQNKKIFERQNEIIREAYAKKKMLLKIINKQYLDLYNLYA